MRAPVRDEQCLLGKRRIGFDACFHSLVVTRTLTNCRFVLNLKSTKQQEEAIAFRQQAPLISLHSRG